MERNLYESLSYNRDYLDNDIVLEEKIKENRGIKGKVTLQLFNEETKQMVKEAYTENLIPELYFMDAFLGHFVQGIMGVGLKREGQNYSWFDYLYLTDNDKPENSKNQRVMGNVIGYAHRNTAYVGSEPLKGTINSTETKLEVTEEKIRLTFVFDFPTHAANGRIESIYWCEADINDKDYLYAGPPITGRETGDLEYRISASLNGRRYYAAYYGFNQSKATKFTSPVKGWILLDGANNSLTQTNHLQFPEKLKGHQIIMPFDINVNDILLWDQAIRLLNEDGDPLQIIYSDESKKYDGLISACPYYENSKELVFIGYYIYRKSNDNYIRIYKWSKVGVLLSQVDVNMSQSFKDPNYNTVFSHRAISTDGVFVDGCIEIIGTTQRTSSQFNEEIYTSRLIRVNANGEKVEDLNVKAKIGNSTWFERHGMNSGNIERRSYVSEIYRSKNKFYLKYTNTQGGTLFWQVISTAGNLIEPYRRIFSFNISNNRAYNILNTDRWLSCLSSTYGGTVSFMISNALTSRPIGAHTKLTQPVEKTEANTMKVQYTFEVDLLTYGEDYY